MTLYRDVILLIIYCITIFYMSHQPTLPVAMTFEHQDKLVHTIAYMIMGILAWHCFRHGQKSICVTAVITLSFSSLYGASDEFHQSFILGRDASVWDWVADTVGATLATLLMVWRGKG